VATSQLPQSGVATTTLALEKECDDLVGTVGEG